MNKHNKLRKHMNSGQSVSFLGFEDLQYQLSQLMQRYFIIPVLICNFEQI